MGCLVKLLAPPLNIIVFAIIGACMGGVPGFITGGVFAIVFSLVFGKAMRAYDGGILPRKAKDELVTDFMSRHQNVVATAYPLASPYQRKQYVEQLFETMARKAVKNSRSNDPDVSMHFMNFLPSAQEVAQEQPSQELRALAEAFIAFLNEHPQWYGSL